MELNDVRTIVANLDDFLELPDGIVRLRRAVLTLAVSGRLVPQASEEGTADELFKKIQEERSRSALNVGRKNKTKELQSVSADEMPFGIPKSWKWVRLGEIILSISGGGTPSKQNPSFWDGSIPWASVKDMTGKKYIDDTKDHITEKGLRSKSELLKKAGSVIVCTRMGLGKIGILMRDMAINQDLKALILSKHIDVEYFYLQYQTFDIKGKGVTVDGITQDQLQAFPFTLPPLAEQKRIVKKVEAVMKELDDLEAKKKEQDAVRERLTRSAMRRFGENEDTLALEHLTELIRTRTDLQELEMAVLTLAVSGKLVPQNKEEDDVTEREIIKTRRSKVLLPVVPEEIPFDIPESWEWSRFGSVFSDYGSGSTPSRGNDGYFSGDVNWYKSGELNDGVLTDDAEEKVSDIALKECHLRMNVPGDLLIAMYGATAGRVSILENKGVTNQAVWGGTPSPYVDVRYLFLYMLQSRPSLIAKGAGAAQPNISGEKILSHLIPLPPLAEQKRIVEKVQELQQSLSELKRRM